MAHPHYRASTSFTRFQRMLLGTDGTVTHILETYAGEPVEVVKLRQEYDAASGVDPALGLSRDERVLRRHVLLRGRDSRRSLLYAEAVVALGRVEPAFLAGLVETDRPIGVLLADNRTETFREILGVGREPAGPLGVHFGLGPTEELIWRTYRVVAGRRSVMLITEKFPAGFFTELPA